MIKRFIKNLLVLPDRAKQGYLPLKIQSNDIFIVEYPKSGITFFCFFLSSLIAKKDNLNIKPTWLNINQFVVDIHLSCTAKHHFVLTQRLLKSHEAYTPKYLQVIYLVRNPIDVMVSFYNYMLDVEEVNLNYKFSEFIRNPKGGINAWLKHVEGWSTIKTQAQKIIVVRYEDLINKNDETKKDIVRMLGYNFSDDDIHEAEQFSSIQYMIESENIYRKYSYSYKMTFVGKDGKKFHRENISEEDLNFIKGQLKDSAVVKHYYPDLF